MSADSHKHIEEKLGIKNNSSVEVLRESTIFQEVLSSIEAHNTTVQTILDNDQKVDNFTDHIHGSGFLDYSIDELRLLKQALNNTICLAIFQKFLEEIKDFSESDIPYLKFNQETQRLDLIAKPVEGFVARDHPEIKNRIKHLNDSERTAMRYGGIVKRILPRSKKHRIESKITGGYLHLFQSFLKDYFYENSYDFIFSGDKRINDDITLSYFFLEVLLKELMYKEHGKSFNSFTGKVSFNSNINLLIAYLYEYSEKNGVMPELDRVKQFLIVQGKAERSAINSSEKTYHRNMGHYVFNDEKGIYITDDSQPCDDFTLSLQDFGGCPFARSKDITNRNPLIHMHEITDQWHIRIIEELERVGKYRGYK